jgi:hypothetical protein
VLNGAAEFAMAGLPGTGQRKDRKVDVDVNLTINVNQISEASRIFFFLQGGQKESQS